MEQLNTLAVGFLRLFQPLNPASAMHARTLLVFLMAALLWLPLQPAAAQDARPPLTLEDLWASGTFFGNYFQGGQWSDEGPVILYPEADPATGATHLIRFDLEKGEETRLIDGASLHAPDVGRLIRIEGYEYSRDGSKVLIFTDTAPVWRLNTKGFYYVYDLSSGALTPLADRDEGHQLFAKLSPDGRRAAFVRDRNLFLVDLATMQETALTTDGAPGTIIYGTTDWVYEEEFGLRDGWSWSPDGRYLAFYQFDESATSDFTMLDLRGRKPEPITFRFPLAGEPNSEVRVGVYDVEAGETRFFDTDTWQEGGDENEYLPRMGWTPEVEGGARVWMMRMNRHQNRLDLLYGDPATAAVETILVEREPAWIEIATLTRTGDKLTFIDDGRHFLWRSEVDGFNHLYLYEHDGDLVRQVTRGDWEVTDFYGYDAATGDVFFSATKESPVESHLYRIPLRPAKAAEPVRITQEKGTHEIDVSKDFRYYLDTYSDRNTPPATRLHTTDGRLVRVLEPNERLAATMEAYAFRPVEFTTVPAADGTPLNALMVKPTDFDPSKRYPLLVFTYGGPNSQEVLDGWNGFTDMWHRYLAGEHGIIVAAVDNRGTPGRGKAFTSQLYRKLGTIEAEDQIAAARHWAKLPYVDADRMGIWGWSYGGYNTLMAMSKYDGPETFKVGVAVAPGAGWDLYDTIYTERYMSTPQQNPQGYAEGNPVNFVDRLRDDQRLLIVQGDLDDNVHFQNTIHLIAALQRANRQFDLMIYPGGNHGMAGTGNPYTYLHLFTKLTDFLTRNL